MNFVWWMAKGVFLLKFIGFFIDTSSFWNRNRLPERCVMFHVTSMVILSYSWLDKLRQEQEQVRGCDCFAFFCCHKHICDNVTYLLHQYIFVWLNKSIKNWWSFTVLSLSLRSRHFFNSRCWSLFFCCSHICDEYATVFRVVEL